MKNDGSSWIVISRGMNKEVEEIYQEKGESSYHEEMANSSGIGKPIGTSPSEKQQRMQVVGLI